MPLLVRRKDRRPDPPPLRTNTRAAIRVGIGVWAVLLVLTLLMRPRLAATGDDWWIWTCVCGVLLGFVGLWDVRRRDRKGPG